MIAHQVPQSLGFFTQEQWSGPPQPTFPSTLYMASPGGEHGNPLRYLCLENAHGSDSVRPHRQQPTRLPSPWDSPVQSVQFSSVAQSCPALCNPMNCSTPGLPVHLAGLFLSLLSYTIWNHLALQTSVFSEKWRKCAVPVPTKGSV